MPVGDMTGATSNAMQAVAARGAIAAQNKANLVGGITQIGTSLADQAGKSKVAQMLTSMGASPEEAQLVASQGPGAAVRWATQKAREKLDQQQQAMERSQHLQDQQAQFGQEEKMQGMRTQGQMDVGAADDARAAKSLAEQRDYAMKQQGVEDSQYRDLTAPALGPTGPNPNLIGMHDLGMTGPTKQTINTRAHAEGGPVYGEGAMSRALRDYGQEPKPRAALDPAETQLKLAQAEEARARATSLGTPKTDPNAALKTQELQARVDEIKARAEKMKRGDGAVKWDTPTTRRYELLKAQADQLLANYQTDDAMAKYKEASDFIDAHGGGAEAGGGGGANRPAPPGWVRQPDGTLIKAK